MKGLEEHAGGEPLPKHLAALLEEFDAKYAGRAVVRVNELAGELCVDPKQIAAAIELGELLAVNIGNTRGNISERKSWRIPLSAAREWIKGRRSV